MRMNLVNNKGQAAAELAILGVLILMSFSFVMNFGQSLGRVQQNKMESFRKALRTAYEKNGTAIYTFRKNYNSANVNSGFFQGQESTAEGSYNVTWSKGVGGLEGADKGMYGYWQVNDSVTSLPTKGQTHYSPTGEESSKEIETPYSVYKVDETRAGIYNYSLDKEESNSAIDYRKRASVIDTTAGTLHMRINTNIDKTPGKDPPASGSEDPSYDKRSAFFIPDIQVYNYAEDWNVHHDDL